VKEQTPEYLVADDIYGFLDYGRMIAHINKKLFWVVGQNEIGWRSL
jgi:hypothetical protein